MLEKAKVHALPTEKAKLVRFKSGNWFYSKDFLEANSELQPHHLYFTSDEEIKEGDWVISPDELIYQAKGQSSNDGYFRKIVATTNPGLRYDANREFHINIYPISPDFIEAFVREQGIWEVMLEKEEVYNYSSYGIRHRINPTHQYKLNSQGAVVVHKVKEKVYTREEFRNACRQAWIWSNSIVTFDSWFDKKYPL
jgi:hypothetical protein